MTAGPFASARARDRAARRALLPILLDRLDRLSPTECDLLREYVAAELADGDEIDAMRRGLDKHRQEQQQRLTAAEAAIIEAEQDRDQAREQLAQAKRWGAVWKSHVLAVDERADRHHAAWRSARKRARTTATELERIRGSLTHWADRGRAAEATLDRIRTPQAAPSDHSMHAVVAAMVGPGIDETTARDLLARYFRAITHQEQAP